MMNSNFSNLSPQLQLIFSSVPIYVSGTQNPDIETSQQAIERQAKFLKLPKSTRWKLASFETGDKIEAIGRKYGFELLRLANITRLIREYYFGEVRLENFPAEIEKRMAVSLLTAQEITRYIKQEIIDWDPWGDYLAKLPRLPLRQILDGHPKLADTEITAGYIELRGSDDLEDPTIKNWVRDYVSHLGYERHSQMDRTEYLFHSENAKTLSSPDREKLGIILKSFDENIPLPVDEENGEIVFEGIENRVGDAHPPAAMQQLRAGMRPAPTANAKAAHTRPLPEEQKSTPQPSFAKATAGKQELFIKPYSPTLQPQRPTPPRPAPPLPPPPDSLRDSKRAGLRPSGTSPRAGEEEKERRNPAIDRYFNAPDSPDIPGIQIQSITEHNEPRIVPQTSPQPSPYKGEGAVRPRHKIIDPFEPRIAEPRLDGNIVDLSNSKE